MKTERLLKKKREREILSKHWCHPHQKMCSGLEVHLLSLLSPNDAITPAFFIFLSSIHIVLMSR